MTLEKKAHGSTRSSDLVVVFQDASALDPDRNIVRTLRALGVTARSLDLRGGPLVLAREREPTRSRPSALIFAAFECADLAIAGLQTVRAETYLDNVGTLVVVNRGRISDVLFSNGFDDFVVPPYTHEELRQRMRALGWRRSEATPPRRTWGRVTIDPASHEVFVDDRPIKLKEKEFALVTYLYARRGTSLTRTQLHSEVWGDGGAGSARRVDVQVCRLRSKLGDALPLETLRGGYRLRIARPEQTQGATASQKTPQRRRLGSATMPSTEPPANFLPQATSR